MSRSEAVGGQRVVAILLTIADLGPSVSVRELADRTGIPQSSVYRYLKLLRAEGLVWTTRAGRYTVGPRAVQLAQRFTESFDLVAVCRPVMQRLASESQETVALVVAVGHRAICVETVESRQGLRYSFTRGAALPLLRGASAKALLPYLRQTVIERAMDEAGLDPAARATLWDEIGRIRERGYAESEGEVDVGVWAVGVPILAPDGQLLAALSVIAPVVRLDAARRQALRHMTLSAAESIYWRLDGREGNDRFVRGA